METKIYIPDQHYVGFQNRTDSDDYDEETGNYLKQTKYLMGFATPVSNDKAFEKRKQTVDTWSRGWNGKRAGKAAEILTNALNEGFEIVNPARRGGSWNGGNVVWQVNDPRGFRLEISSENLAQILECGVVRNGLIEGRCIWGRQGSVNVLLPENSQPYKDSITQDERNETRKKRRELPASDLKIGDTVEMMDGAVRTYLGRVFLTACCRYFDGSGTSQKTLTDKVFLYYSKEKRPGYTYEGLEAFKSQRAVKVLGHGGEVYTFENVVKFIEDYKKRDHAKRVSEWEKNEHSKKYYPRPTEQLAIRFKTDFRGWVYIDHISEIV